MLDQTGSADEQHNWLKRFQHWQPRAIDLSAHNYKQKQTEGFPNKLTRQMRQTPASMRMRVRVYSPTRSSSGHRRSRRSAR